MDTGARRSSVILLLVLAVSVSTFSVAIAAPARISSEELLASPFARAFKAGRSTDALAALDALLARHPDDPLLLRYRAATLSRLGRTGEAIGVYQALLARHPGDVAAHLFLGRAYARHGQAAQAVAQWRWVVQHSPSGDYRRWAQQSLDHLRVRAGRAKRSKRQRPYLVGKTGVRSDSNPLLKPNDKSLASPGNEKAGGAAFVDLSVGYPLVLARDARLDVLYIGQHTFQDANTDRVNFLSEGMALDAKRRVRVGARPVLLGARYDLRASFLRSDLFSFLNRVLLSADTSFSPHTRTHVYGRVGVVNVGPDGPEPSQTSRDGVRSGLGVTEYLYSRDFRSYLFIKQEANLQAARGSNFDRDGWLSRIGVRTPAPLLPKRTDLDLSLGFDLGTYPKFVSRSSLDPTRRRDARLDVYTALTHHWNPALATRLSYRFINGDNRNDFYDRERHLVTAEVIFAH